MRAYVCMQTFLIIFILSLDLILICVNIVVGKDKAQEELRMKQSNLAKKAIETLKRADTLTKPVLVTETKKRINIALVDRKCNTVEYVLSFGIETGVVRIYNCGSCTMFLSQLRVYETLADELRELSKGAE